MKKGFGTFKPKPFFTHWGITLYIEAFRLKLVPVEKF